MEASKVRAKFGDPIRKERNADGSEEWYYNVWEKEKTTKSSFDRVEPEGGTSSGASVETEFKSVERSVSISAEGKVEGIPSGKIIRSP